VQVLAETLRFNTSLLTLILDMNPVGAAGAKEMVMLTLPDEDDTDAAQYEAGTKAERTTGSLEDDDRAAAAGTLASGIQEAQSELPQVQVRDAASVFVGGAFAKKGRTSGLKVWIEKCTLGPQESNKDAMQFDEDEPAGQYVLNLARIFDQVVLRSLVRLTLERKGGFKAGVTMDGKKALIRLIFLLDSLTSCRKLFGISPLILHYWYRKAFFAQPLDRLRSTEAGRSQVLVQLILVIAARGKQQGL